MTARLFLAVFLLVTNFLSPKVVVGQTNLTSAGPCNQNISGNNNTVIVNCTVSGSEVNPTNEVLVAINFGNPGGVHTWVTDGFGNWQRYYLNFQNIYVDQSGFALEVAEKRYAYSLQETWSGGFQDLELGRHPYSMTFEIVYGNWYRTTAVCRGILDLRSSATLTPLFNVRVDPITGNINAIDCSFIATQ